MPTLIMCKGIPGSGKSYWADDYASTNSNVIVVTRDDIRDEFGCTTGGWSPEKEGKVIEEMTSRIWMGLKAGKTVISADTNLKPQHEARLRRLAKLSNSNFVMKTFDTPLDECIERDSYRKDHHRVGADRIREYYQIFLDNRKS